MADDFDRADSNGLGNTSTGGFAWNEQETVASGLRIESNGLTAGSTTAGREYATIDLLGLAGYSTTLHNNDGLITWAINMKTSRSDPSGFDSNGYGIAFVLASSSSDYANGSGYAVLLGQKNTEDLPDDPIRLAKFDSGLDLNSNFSDIISGGDYSSEHLNVRVTYDPNGDIWALYASSSPSSGGSFSDPTLVVSQVGSTVSDSTYTGSSLRFTGVLWNHATSSSEKGIFDNFSMQVVPEPSAYGIVSALALGGVLGLNRWRERRSQSRL